MTRERLQKPMVTLQRQPETTPKARISSGRGSRGAVLSKLELQAPTPVQLEVQRQQTLEIQRRIDLEQSRLEIQRAQDARRSQARVSQANWQAGTSKTLALQRALYDHARTARVTAETRAEFVVQRQADHLEGLVAQRLEAELLPPLPVAQRQADLSLSHVAEHMRDKAEGQIQGDPNLIRNYQGFKNTGAALVKHFRSPGSSHTMTDLAGAIQRFTDPGQRGAVESAAFAALGHHPSFPGQLQRALDAREEGLELQRETWQRELEPLAQRQALEETSGENAAELIAASQGGGQALPANVKAMLETKWNVDLSRVRVHTDSSADGISKKLNAKALTTGNDMFFRSGTWNPTSLEGLQLIAHETWHTQQQANGLVQAGVDRDHGLELEAQGKGAELSYQDLQTVSSSTPRVSGAVRTIASRAPLTTPAEQRSATPIPSSLTTTTTRNVGNLEGLMSSAPIFGPSVQRAADGTSIQRSWWNPFDWAAEGAKWLGAKFMDGLEFLGEKAARAFMEVFAAAAKPFGETGKRVLQALKSIGKSLLQVIANPGAFANNLLHGVKLGFGNFITYAPEHLSGVLGGWLGGKGLNLQFPTKLEPLPILMALLSSLNLGWDAIRAKIARQLGPKGNQAIAAAEKSVPLVSSLSKGLHNSAEFTQEVLPTLKTQAVDGLKSAAQESLIRAGINVLLKLIPGAGTISAIFDTVSVLVSKASDIAGLVQNVMGSFAAIAAGNVSSAATAIERSLLSGMRVALDFVARLVKIDSFIARVRNIIGKVTTKISSVADPLIARAVKLVRPLLDKLGGKGNPKGKNATPPTKKSIDGVYGKKSFTAAKEPHSVWAKITNAIPTLIIASTPREAKTQFRHLRLDAEAKLTGAEQTKAFLLAQQGQTQADQALTKIKAGLSKNQNANIGALVEPFTSQIADTAKHLFELIGGHESAGLKTSMDRQTVVFKCKKSLDKPEFERQVNLAEREMNSLSIEQFLKQRSRFFTIKAEQQAAGVKNPQGRDPAGDRVAQDAKRIAVVELVLAIRQGGVSQLQGAARVDTQNVINYLSIANPRLTPVQQQHRIQLKQLLETGDKNCTREEAGVKAQEIISFLAVLHKLDQTAGGSSTKLAGQGTQSLGDPRVDYSLGAQWKKHAQTLEIFIRKNISVKVYPTAKMNVDLKVI